ncbi:ATP-binding response regulator [Viridibacterium curvum]|uniref:Response regulatory domain-containing protein n=1 Tax=Viridibacterium curvum TaxID=1101404 RepID=A0ABP9QDY6_9RHOO
MGLMTCSMERSEATTAGRLLLVDDEENILSSLRRLLRRDGYEIRVAGSGAEGLEILKQVEIDVIVSDQRMPGMTGTEFLKEACRLYPSTVRIVLSGYTELESVTRAINEGSVYRFLTKPWDDEQLRRHILEAVRHKRVEDENLKLQEQLRAANQRMTALLDERQEALLLDEVSLQFAHELLADLPLPVLGVDGDGLVVVANDAMESLLELPMVGMDAMAVLPSELSGLLAPGIERAEAMFERGGCRYRVLSAYLRHGREPRGRLLAFFAKEV